MSRIPLTFACGDYDRTRGIAEGAVPVDGADITYLRLPVEETFFRMLRHREFDVAEMSLSTYVATLDKAGSLAASPFVALPVYTSRFFRHGGIFINTEAGIIQPSDLRGKRIGMPEVQLTAVVWQRGILADHYGVPLDSARYFTGGEETPGRVEKGKVDVPFDVRPIPEDRTLSRMLADGEIDAILAPRIPSTFDPKGGSVARLFDDPKQAEQDYFRETGIFPIMHVVVVRRDVYERYPWVAQSLTKALTIAKKQASERIYDASAAADGAVAHGAPRAGPHPAGPGLLVIRCRPFRPQGARDLPAVPPRAGPVAHAARAGGDLRARVAGVFRHLTLADAEGPGADPGF